MRIGLSVRARRGEDFWRDSTNRHALLLAAAFARLPFVRAVTLVDSGGENRPRDTAHMASAGRRINGLPELLMVTQQQASDLVDVIVDAGSGLDGAWLDFMRSRGCRVIGCRGTAGEARDAAPSGSSHDRHDELWLLPKDALALPLLRTRYRCPLRVVPFLWSPMFVERRVAALARSGVHFGYRAAHDARVKGWRVAAFEADLPALREPGVAMLACEAAYRTAPTAVSALHVLNARPLKTTAQRPLLADTFDLVRDRRTTFHGPHDLVDFVGRHADALLTHQQHDGDAYGYLDVLYGDYALIHNSPWLLDAGYYYPGADVQQGARTLLAALHCHDATLDTYHARSRAVFDAFDPFSHANLAAYADALAPPGSRVDPR